MCNLCDNFRQNARHLAERGVELVEQWNVCPLDDGQHALLTAALIHVLHVASKDLSPESLGQLKTAQALHERSLTSIMLRNPQHACTLQDQQLVTVSSTLAMLVEVAVTQLEKEVDLCEKVRPSREENLSLN